MGHHLRAALGAGYVAIGQYFGQGSFQAWDMNGLPAKRGVRSIAVGPAPGGYLEATLTGAAPSPWLLDLRQAPASGPVRDWLRRLHRARDLGALYRDEEGSRAMTVLQGRFDAIVFHDRVTASHPNPTGRRGASR
jgi:erythromycin esterase-like protein